MRLLLIISSVTIVTFCLPVVVKDYSEKGIEDIQDEAQDVVPLHGAAAAMAAPLIGLLLFPMILQSRLHEARGKLAEAKKEYTQSDITPEKKKILEDRIERIRQGLAENADKAVSDTQSLDSLKNAKTTEDKLDAIDAHAEYVTKHLSLPEILKNISEKKTNNKEGDKESVKE